MLGPYFQLSPLLLYEHLPGLCGLQNVPHKFAFLVDQWKYLLYTNWLTYPTPLFYGEYPRLYLTINDGHQSFHIRLPRWRSPSIYLPVGSFRSDKRPNRYAMSHDWLLTLIAFLRLLSFHVPSLTVKQEYFRSLFILTCTSPSLQLWSNVGPWFYFLVGICAKFDAFSRMRWSYSAFVCLLKRALSSSLAFSSPGCYIRFDPVTLN